MTPSLLRDLEGIAPDLAAQLRELIESADVDVFAGPGEIAPHLARALVLVEPRVGEGEPWRTVYAAIGAALAHVVRAEVRRG